jgi:peptide/nickel transport system ATP-binding protein
MSRLEVSGLTVDFRQRGGGKLRAVSDVSFELEPGVTLALVGESGSGKSTVVRALALLQPTTAGSIRLDGNEVTRRRTKAYRRLVQLVFQDPFASLNPVHTVGHHLARPLLLQGQAQRGVGLDRAVLELLESVNLTPASDMVRKYPHELSGGQRQRVAIARALATSPQVLLADEPVSMLDVSIRLEILNLLKRLQQERQLALLYVTHDLATARHFSDHVMVMYRGEVVERGPSDAVIVSPSHPYTQLLAAAAPSPSSTPEELADARRIRAAVRSSRTAEQREVEVDGGCTFLPRCPHAMPACASHPTDVATPSGALAKCWLYDTDAAPSQTPIGGTRS